MSLFEVYPRFEVEIIKAKGSWVWDREGKRYLDFYGGHAVISIGHAHPHWLHRIQAQMEALPFYSNSVLAPIQEELAERLAHDSGYPDYRLFLCNSGAEANENALKLASAHNQRREIIAFSGGFHGRTSLAVAVTDNPSIVFPVNEVDFVHRLQFGELDKAEDLLKTGKISSVIIEGIQGIGGVHIPHEHFLQAVSKACAENGTVLILDEIQSGFGRSGSFFAHQLSGIKADIISMAKGMGNGFPVGGILVSPEFESKNGILGSTFGGNHMACAAVLAVLEVMEKERLLENSREMGNFLMDELRKIPEIKEVRGSGLMIGLQFEKPVKDLRKKLLMDYRVFTGSSSDPDVLRLLPPLSINKEEAVIFIESLKEVLK
jgi:acetylornithine aminotransferase